MIIDMHSHIGDILNPNGRAVIYRKGAKRGFAPDPTRVYERRLWRSLGPIDRLLPLTTPLMIRGGQADNMTATLENMRTSMDQAGVTKTVCLPIPPYVTFDDLREAHERDRRIIPFTGFNPEVDCDWDATFRDHVSRGAKGLKLHPIIHNEPLTSEKTSRAVEAFAPYGLPVLFHSGIAHYYTRQQRYKQNPDYGRVEYARLLVEEFPNVPFVVGHSGMMQIEDSFRMLPGHPNAYFEISFVSPENISRLVHIFGPERVLFGSDWPWAKRATGVMAVKAACKGDKALENLILFENASRLLGLSDRPV